MKLSRDPGTFLLLCFNQLSGHSRQRLFRSFAISYVAQNTGGSINSVHTRNLAVLVFGRPETTLTLVHSVLSLAVTIALAAYGLDCLGMATPQRAMQCCNTMRCHRHGSHHSQDCCNTTSHRHAAIGQPSPVQSGSFSPVVFAVAGVPTDPQIEELHPSIITAHSHDPPISRSTLTTSLRI